MSKECLICGEKTDRPIAATLWHLRIYDRGNWKFLKGNTATFGRWDGFWSTVYLAFPIICTVRFWRVRKCYLVIPPGADVCVTEDK